MLYTLAVIFSILLFVSLLTSYAAENEIHSLLVIAILGVVIRIVQSKGEIYE
jgi:uncharacterized membrane-anchored protein YitT (DUF2179 family)